ncbi:MAG: Mor transcription activator family protein [Methylovulum sp.]
MKFAYEIINNLCEAIGVDATRELVKNYGGESIFFPKQGSVPPHIEVDPASWLVLCSHFGGTAVYIPKCYKEFLQHRDAQIKAEYARGASITSLVRRFKLSNRRIIAICQRVDKDTGTDKEHQFVLF